MKNKFFKLGIVFAILLTFWFLPTPKGLTPETWRIVAVYLGLLAGLIIRPFSEPVITLILVGILAMFVDTNILLQGFGNSMAWFILTVTIVCTAFVKTGLGKRLAYRLLLKAGNSTLALGYTLVATDLLLSPATGSNTSRTSIIYPIFRSIAEGAGSTPEKEPKKLGAYLSILMYITSQGTSSLFLTGMATNAVTVSLIKETFNLEISWGTWLLASCVPVGLFLLLAPWIVYKICPPELKSLDGVKQIAAVELEKMGAMTSAEKKLLVTFILAILGWMFGPQITFLNLEMQIVGFVFLAIVLLTEVLDWDDVIGAKGAWNIFVWYGAFFGIATALSNEGFYTWLAERIGNVLDLSQVNGLVVAILLLVISLAVRYFFVSNSAFVASFYPVLFSVALNTQANKMLVSLLLAYFAGLGALLTHYGNGAGLVTFAPGFLKQNEFWKVGTIMVGVALIIFLLLGLPYWKIIGLW